MPSEAAPTAGASQPMLAGDILWLAVTIFAFAVIMGIVCLPLSAGLSPSFVAGAGAGGPTASALPEASASATLVAPTFIYSVNRVSLADASPTMAGEVGEGLNSDATRTSIAAPVDPAAVKPPLRDPITDRPPSEPLANRAELIPIPRGPQPARSASASPPVHQSDLRRLRQPRQRMRPAAHGAGAELVPW
jgi:hypothetical protein